MLYTASPQPLFDWFDKDRGNRALLRLHGYTDGRITNWKRRGIPVREVGFVARLMGLTYEQYMLAAEAHERKTNWRRVAALAVLAILPQLQASRVEAATYHNVFSQPVILHINARRWLRLLRRFAMRSLTVTVAAQAAC